MADTQKKRRTESLKRTQAERLAETRRKIIDATVACIDAFGFPKTTMQRVARKAGVTVGAVQHHFPSKSELLAGVLEDGFRKASFEREHIRFSGKALPERVSLFVDHCWLLYREPTFQANLHILLGMRVESPQALDEWLHGPLADLTAQVRNMLMSVFEDVELTEDACIELMYFVFSTLNGTATFARIIDAEHQEALVQGNLGALKELLLARFTGAGRFPGAGGAAAKI